jgi:hypothetical protein
MVDRSGGQLYTIEGFAAAILMIVTAWIVLGTTSVYTPGDTHISDMQLEQLGTDVLLVMDTPAVTSMQGSHIQLVKSPLQTFIENKDGNGPVLFNNMFLAYCNNKTDGSTDNIQYMAWVYNRHDADNETYSYVFNSSRQLTQGDHAVRVTRWVLVDNSDLLNPAQPPSNVLDPRVQEVLVEVLLWKG